MSRVIRRFVFAAVAASVLVTAGCATESSPVAGDNPAQGERPADGDEVAAATALIQERFELVSAGNYEAVCELYSDAFTDLFVELAAVPDGTCVEAHEAAQANSDAYLATAADQERLGLTPFFYLPSDIEIDSSAIKVDKEGLAFLGEGTVLSLDPREFEDGVGKTPGWLAAQDYVKLGDDGVWRYIAATEQ